MAFAVITPALITGSFVERVRFKAFLLFAVLWATLVYDPVAHWVWSTGGALHQLGALDFAGGTVVHVTAGFSALAFALVIRPRKGFGAYAMEPHNIPYSVLGAGLLWFGWFGFNGGSALAANGLAVTAVVNTNLAAAAAGLVWMFLSWRDDKPSVLGIATGAVVGLVAITPAAGYVTPMSAILIGGLAAPISYYAMRLRQRGRLDESLDVWACHGMGGAVGRVGHRHLCDHDRQQRRGEWSALWQPDAIPDPAADGGGGRGLRLYPHHRDHQGLEPGVRPQRV